MYVQYTLTAQYHYSYFFPFLFFLILQTDREIRAGEVDVQYLAVASGVTILDGVRNEGS